MHSPGWSRSFVSISCSSSVSRPCSAASSAWSANSRANLAGFGRIAKIVQSHSMRSTITVHAHTGPTVLEDLETLVRRSGLDVLTVSNRQENVDLVIDFELRGSKRLYDQAVITLLHHNHVRTVSTGE